MAGESDFEIIWYWIKDEATGHCLAVLVGLSYACPVFPLLSVLYLSLFFSNFHPRCGYQDPPPPCWLLCYPVQVPAQTSCCPCIKSKFSPFREMVLILFLAVPCCQWIPSHQSQFCYTIPDRWNDFLSQACGGSSSHLLEALLFYEAY